MKFDPFKHHRRSVRLRGYDYSQAGAYFVTLCTRWHERLFGDIVGAGMDLNEWGTIADECWQKIPQHFPNVELDEYVVMPNHLHGIIVIVDPVGATHASPRSSHPNATPPHAPLAPQQRAPGPKPKSIGSIVGSFKPSVSRRTNELHETPGADPWQRGYYDHIVRNEREWNAIAKYIQENPLNWSADLDNPAEFTRRSPPRDVGDYLQAIGIPVTVDPPPRSSDE